jgi:hypothetical protein
VQAEPCAMWSCLANRALLLVQQLPSSIDVELRTSSVSCPTVLVHAMKPTLLSYQTVFDTVHTSLVWLPAAGAALAVPLQPIPTQTGVC